MTRSHIEQEKFLRRQIEILRKEREWQDIDSAPKDGTRLMLFAGIDKINTYGEFFSPHRVVGYWCGTEECWFAHSYVGQPMVKLRAYKWQHLPPFPKMIE